jgi:hypothetical protein
VSRRRLRTVVHALTLFALHVLIFRGMYFSGNSFPFDFGATYYALPAYWIAAVQAGDWPSWLPYVGMGFPFAANPQSGSLYPPLWAFALLHWPYTLTAASILQALHIFAGSLGLYVLVRLLYGSPGTALLGGVGYLVYGGFYTNSEHPDIVRAFALTPWLLTVVLLRPVDLHSIRLSRWRGASALTWRNLALPLVGELTVSGAYPGNAIAFGVTLTAFTLTQTARNVRSGQKWSWAAIDLLALGGLTVLGILLAGAFVVPLISSGGELVRGSASLEHARAFLGWIDLYELVLSPASLPNKDHSMFGMQLPLPLFPFLLYVGRAELGRLAPFLALAAVAAFMCLEPLAGLSSVVLRAVPVLALSRFPSGDYRTLVAITILLAMCGGVCEFLRQRKSAWRYAIGLIALCLVLLPGLIFGPPPDSVDIAWVVFISQLMPAIGLAVMLARVRRARSAVTALATIVSLLSVPLMLTSMLNWWVLPDAEAHIAQLAGVRPDVRGVFAARYSSRPARQEGANEFAISWRGYLAGQFMMSDYGGATTVARQRVDADPDLRRFMAEPSALVTRPAVDGFTWQVLEYGRARIRYRIDLPVAAVVAENELFSSGWHGTTRSGAGTAMDVDPVAVDGAVRGWNLPAGMQELTVTYSTPRRGMGAAVSVGAAMVYLVLLVSRARGAGLLARLLRRSGS